MAPLIPTLAARARSILTSAAATHNQAVQTASERLSQLGPLAARAILLSRDDNDNNDNNQNADPQALDPSIGVTDPNDINNTFIFILFGLIGVAFVVTGIWFFFWARNGGFHFKEDDWDDYKSTVLRRKGPNGTLLSNATPSTNLGGGSIYKDVADADARTEYTGGLTQMTGDTGDTGSTLSGITAGPSDIGGRERRRRAREQKEREREKRRDRRRAQGSGGGGSRRKVDEHGVLVDEEAEEDAKRNLRAYRHERPARVGGLNKESEASEWDGSTNPEMSTVSGAEPLLAGRQDTPTKDREREREREKRRSGAAPSAREHYDPAPTELTADTVGPNDSASQVPSSSSRRTGGIRKVYSTADRTTSRENERLRAEARRLAAERVRGGGASASSVTSASSASSASHLRRGYSCQRADLRTAGSAIAEESETGSLMADHLRSPPVTTTTTRNTAGAAARHLLPAPESDIGDGTDLGTKSYRHYIPGLSSAPSAPSVAPTASEATEHTEDRRERRKRREAQRARRE
ncbi:putative endosomal spry domain-containing protein [Rosellinia necatrix]|uniref:Putative endosomal spry domain-containing protein n=1 Tax=Rosellinia necatrix TaxID=77044 RepID=A0A1W2TQQ4_ROSNE|nr:putative endosomal spry domain-containing protein [Rosellinia necatrix]